MHKEFVYVLRSDRYYKIGRTRNVESRIGTISLQMPFPVELIKVFNTDDSIWLEKLFHVFLNKTRMNGEWFLLSDADIEWLMAIPATVQKPILSESFAMLDSLSFIADNGLSIDQFANMVERGGN